MDDRVILFQLVVATRCKEIALHCQTVVAVVCSLQKGRQCRVLQVLKAVLKLCKAVEVAVIVEKLLGPIER